MKMSRKVSELVNLLDLERFVFTDIGAAKGFDKRWNMLSDYLFVIGFEPEKKEFKNLVEGKKHKNIKYYNCCLAEKPSRLKFFVSQQRANSSCLKPNLEFLKRFPMSERFSLVGESSIDADNLDNILLPKKVDFVKIDTQGSELNILKGSTKTLENVCGLEIEVEFSTLYEGQSLFADVDLYLRGLGFQLFDLNPCHWRRNLNCQIGRGQIVFADALYFKDYISLNSIPPLIGPSIMAAVIYKKYDFATELISFFHKKGCLSLENKKKIESIILNLGKPIFKIPNFKGKNRIIFYLEEILNLLKSGFWARYRSF